MKNLFSLFVFSLVLSACAGTGNKNISSVSFEKPKGNKSSLYFFRENVFVGSAGLVKLLVNGEEIGKIGVDEFIQHDVESGSVKIRAANDNLLQAGVGADVVAFTAKPEGLYYFIITMKQKLFSTSWKISETTKSGYKQANE